MLTTNATKKIKNQNKISSSLFFFLAQNSSPQLLSMERNKLRDLIRTELEGIFFCCFFVRVGFVLPLNLLLSAFLLAVSVCWDLGATIDREGERN